MYKKIIKAGLILSTALIFTACEKKVTTEVHEVHWDRDMCARCVMVVSDRNQTVQMINPTTGKTHIFDDLGCAIEWTKEQEVQWKDEAVIWINDISNAKWINARTAFYDTENITPMSYGYGAHESKDSIKEGSEIISFEEVKKRILTK